MRKTQEALVCVPPAYLKLETYIFVSMKLNFNTTDCSGELHICAGSPEQSLFVNAIGVKTFEYTRLLPYQFGSNKSPVVARLSTPINKEISECRSRVNQIGIKLGRCQHVIKTHLIA